jgi:hypothetical protein
VQITKKFLDSELRELEQEVQKANTFLVQAQATISAYKMLIGRLDAPELEEDDVNIDA